VVMVKQPGHLTSMKKDRGPGTRVYIHLISDLWHDMCKISRTLSLCLRASACGVGLRRSTARTYGMIVSALFSSIRIHFEERSMFEGIQGSCRCSHVRSCALGRCKPPHDLPWGRPTILLVFEY
jgi:hypothetical protein